MIKVIPLTKVIMELYINNLRIIIMRKLLLTLILFAFCTIFFVGAADDQEEIDFLLFYPNSGNKFVNEKQAAFQLDNLAKYLKGKTLVPGQIIIYGYAAEADNDIDSLELSKNRAVFVIDERGASVCM